MDVHMCVCMFFLFFFFFKGSVYPCVRTVLDVLTQTSSSLAFLCPRGTTAKHYFASVATAV